MNHFTKLVSIMLLIFASACPKMEERPCGPHGIPVEGSEECFCDFYYEGPYCETEIREKFIGTWLAYDYKCSFGDSLPDGFPVVISKVDEVSKVKIESSDLFANDTIVSGVEFVGFLRYEAFELVGNQRRRTFDMDIYHNSTTDELTVFIGRNEDLDEFTENCNCILRRE